MWSNFSMDWSTVILTLIGSAAGSGAVVLIDFLLKNRQKKKNNLKVAVNIAISINYTLNFLLEMFEFYSKQKDIIVDKKFCFIHFPTFFLLEPDMNWDLSQFLSFRKDIKTSTLKNITASKFSCLQLIGFLNKRNELHGASRTIISKYKINNPEMSEENIFKSYETLETIIGRDLMIDLCTFTNFFFKTLPQVIKTFDNTFKSLQLYVQKDFSFFRKDNLTLSTDEKLLKVLKNIKTSPEAEEILSSC